MRPLSLVIRIKGNQRRPLTIFDHTFDVHIGVFSCSEKAVMRGLCESGPWSTVILAMGPGAQSLFLLGTQTKPPYSGT